MWKLMVAFIPLVAIVSGHSYPILYQLVRSDHPSYTGNQYHDRPPVNPSSTGNQYHDRPPLLARRRNSFGGSSYHGGAATVELNPAHQPRIQNYSVRVGQGLGPHRSEYFDKKSPWPTQQSYMAYN